ncbi:hypothetical protein K504DRAFT_538882 [Pleomassaria siparia CBS 279.74]|uniref:Uncharacterized protein n=1 Tax=Pleomassaria siparia CBS 279.74 TaxID=1314801 RepID=A0A6G1JT83_9PLEO|nr:hypothetical protein K504DRAFT_538882 [Pleomassaria siparia CBS 279.74]
MSAPMSAHVSETSAQETLASQYDREEPVFSVSEYARIMHEHTKAQLSIATNSARRRSQTSPSSTASDGTSSVGATPE